MLRNHLLLLLNVLRLILVGRHGRRHCGTHGCSLCGGSCSRCSSGRRSRVALSFDLNTSHIVTEFRVPFDKILVVTGPSVRSFRNALESPQIQTPLKGLVLLAGKVSRHDFRTKIFLVVHLEPVSPREPRDDGRLAILFRQVQHLVELPRKLQELASTVTIPNGSGGGSHRRRRCGGVSHQLWVDDIIGIAGLWLRKLDGLGLHLGKHLLRLLWQCLHRWCGWNNGCWR
mmetsp:Transcript_22401/g.55524  ORF Transcript_22401/g.55524 Transcript_22401/m.55524 type:complete len:229 (+) Transcript_22401:1989-2675(+)